MRYVIAKRGRTEVRLICSDEDESSTVDGLVADGWGVVETGEEPEFVEEEEPMKYSRWGIIKALEKRGLADAFDAYLDSNKAAFRRFYGPQFFRADDADFKEMLKTLQGAFSLTDADIAAILAESPYTED